MQPRFPVGRRVGKPGIGQDSINRLLIEAAQSGKRAVRLKGGDPFIFGRGGEEIEALRKAGIPYTVVPGITAGIGAAAMSEVPLTFRHEALRITLLTAHKAKDAEVVDWSGLTDTKMTVVVYMGMTAAPAIRAGLLAAGRSPKTPVGVFARVTRRGREIRGRHARRAAGTRRAGRSGTCNPDHRRRRGAFGALARRRTGTTRFETANGRRMTSPLQQKLKITGPSIVTANRTSDGVVIYRTASKGWSTELSQAAVVRTADDAKALWAEAMADDLGAVGSYIAPVAVGANGALEPGNFREKIRLRGTTFALPASA